MKKKDHRRQINDLRKKRNKRKWIKGEELYLMVYWE